MSAQSGHPGTARQHQSPAATMAHVLAKRRSVATHHRFQVAVPEHLRVLLVEDDPGYSRLVKMLLASRAEDFSRPRFQLTGASYLGEGLAALMETQPDVVLLDLGLPDSAGVQTLERMREQAPWAAIVVLTAASDERLALEALRQGAQDYLIKTETDGEKLARSIRYAVERQRLLEAIENLSLVDDLTGLHNRRGFFMLAERQLKQARRKHTSAALLAADLDGLKQINDRFGHQEGDRAIVLVAQCLKRACREIDVVARLGGDEFAVLLADADEATAKQVVARLQERLERTNRRHTSRFDVRVSIGLAYLQPDHDESLEGLIARADDRMYRNKRAPRPRRGPRE